MNYSYIRFSTNSQDEQQQMNNLNNFAKLKGITIDKFIMDEGVSGGVSYKERKLYELVKNMQAGDTLITTEISRLGRSMSDLNKLINDELKPRKIRLIVVQMAIDLDCSNIKAMDEMMLFAFSFAAQLEKELIQSRTINALEARKRKGIAIGGTNELWGKNTGSDRKKAISKAAYASATKRKESAMNNEANKAFREFIEDWQAIHGKITANTDFKPIADKLNERGKVTATGLEFNSARAKAMYNKIKTLYEL